MEAIAVSKLKASLSEYLKRVKSGSEIIVTERGKPVAKILPFDASDSVPEDLRDLEQEGLISIGKKKLPLDFWRLPQTRDSDGLVLKALLEERAKGR